MKIKLSRLLAIIAVVVVVIISGVYFTGEDNSVADESKVKFAQCLSEKGAVMHGAFWCSACKQQKDLFGKEAFKEITYVECDPKGENAQPNICLVNGVESYPTWLINGQTHVGVQSLERLGELTECEL